MEKLIWKTERVEVLKLKLWEDNPRTLDEKSFEDIKKSLSEDGDWGVIVCDVDYTVISGNQRVRGFIDEKVEFADVKVPNRALTLKEKRRIALRANRTKGKDNWDILANWDEDDLSDGWLSEEDIMMRIGLSEAENQYVDEDRFNVLMVMPPGSPVLKERVNLECKTFDDYLKIKKYIEENGSNGVVEMILGMI